MWSNLKLIKKIEKETGEFFLYTATTTCFKFSKKYYIVNKKNGTYYEWCPKNGKLK